MRKQLVAHLLVWGVWILLGTVLGYLRAKADGRNYCSEAIVYYDPAPVEQPVSTGSTTLSALLGSDVTLQRAVQRGQLYQYVEFQDDPQLVATLRGRLEVSPDIAAPGAYRVRVWSRTAAAARPALQSVLDAAEESYGELNGGVSSQYLDQLTAICQLLEDRLRVLRAIDPGEEAQPIDGDMRERLAYWENRCEQLRRQIAYLQGQAAVAGGAPAAESVQPRDATGSDSRSSASAPNTSPPAQEIPSEQLDQRDRIAQLRRQFLEPLMEKQQQLAKQFGRDHAELKEVRKRIEIISTLLSTTNPPPAEAIPLMVDEQILLEQYGRAHPKVQQVRKRIEEIMDNVALRTTQSGHAADAGAGRTEESPRSAAPVTTSAGPVPDTSSTSSQTRPSLGEELASAEAQLAYSEHALKEVRYAVVLRDAMARLSELQQRTADARARLRVLSKPSAAVWAWQRDARFAAVGGAVGLICALVMAIGARYFGVYANPSASASRRGTIRLV
jgi:hypothetical protein